MICVKYFVKHTFPAMMKLIILTRSSLRPILWPLQYLIKPPFILIRKDGRYLKIRRGRLQNEGAEGPDVPIAAHFAFKFWNNSNLKYLIYRIIQIEIVVPFMLKMWEYLWFLVSFVFSFLYIIVTAVQNCQILLHNHSITSSIPFSVHWSVRCTQQWHSAL